MTGTKKDFGLRKYCQKNLILVEKKFLVTDHADFVINGSIFFAFEGKTFSGITFIIEAIKNGAIEVVVSSFSKIPQETKDFITNNSILLTISNDIDKDFALYSSRAYNYPEKKLKIIGITGTKGKTSTAVYVHTLLNLLGKKSALITTAYNEIGDMKLTTDFTTPKANYIYAFLAECVNQGVEYVVMEVSAQALSKKRIYGIEFEGAIFTNFSQEHAEFYETQEDYFNAKKSIYSCIKKDGFLIINGDEEKIVKSLVSISPSIKVEKQGVGVYNNAHIVMKNNSFVECTAEVIYKNNTYTLKTKLHGFYNCQNCVSACLAIINLCHLEDRILEKLFSLCFSLNPVSGRSERYVLPGDRYICIDRAHTPSSFEAVLYSLSQQTNHLIVVFGCGGERDAFKRPIMAAIAEQYAQDIYVTMDNPRKENITSIIHDIIAGFAFTNNIFIISDRERAIKEAVTKSKKNSIIALLGKGGEEYQIINDVKIPFSELDIITSLGAIKI